MDIGESINPGIDRGQIIGGFIQGVGWVTNEELRYSDKGELLSFSPTTYKIPNIQDLPNIFKVETIKNPHHQINIRRSKAVGEPPLMLCLSVWAAVKHALSSVQKGKCPQLNLPATAEEILSRLTELKPKANENVTQHGAEKESEVVLISQNELTLKNKQAA
jgi:Xanthine dehydrogenase, molybdopterin-binding subunit B